MGDELARLPELFTAHLGLTLFPLLFGVCVSVPLGVLATRSRLLGRVALNAAALIQTVPSLALLALMVPILGALGASSIGYLPAFVALVLYSILPILRNTVTALGGIDPAVVEAARGVGMSSRERLLRVELPLSLPVIVAGVRTAAVWTVGAATLATPVGADSLGNYIFAGLQTRNVGSVVIGCVAAAVLALSLDGLGKLLFVGVERRSRPLTLVALSSFLLLYLYTGVALAARFAPSRAERATIGAKTFTEQYILADILAQRLSGATGLDTKVKQSLGSSVAFDALRQGSINVYVDYTGTIWSNIMKRRDVPRDRRVLFDEMSKFLRERDGIRTVARLGFENSYALVMRRADAERLGVRRIGDLQSFARQLTIGGDYEFFSRPEWRALKRTYGLEFRSQTSMDSSLMYQAVRDRAVNVLSAFSTDGRIAAFDLVVLEDERGAIPPYDAVILASRAFAARAPQAIEALRGLEGRLDARQMRKMNLAVDAGGRSPADVAREFVSTLGPTPARKEEP